MRWIFEDAIVPDLQTSLCKTKTDVMHFVNEECEY
jgi:hypothetical protein